MTESRAFIKSTVTVCAYETCNCPPKKPWGQAYLSIPSGDEPVEQFLASFRRRMKTVKKWKGKGQGEARCLVRESLKTEVSWLDLYATNERR